MEIRRHLRPWVAATAVVVGAALAPAVAAAIEQTDVLDAFDDDNGDPFDGALSVRFTTETRSAVIGRQSRCLSRDVLGSVCPNGSGFVLARELEYSRTRNTMNFDVRIGLYKDLEIYSSFPIVLSDDWKHEFVHGVSRANSTILPYQDNATGTLADRSSLFKVPYQSTSRGGFGDMRLGFKWSPVNFFRDTGDPTWTVRVEYTAPTGTPMRADNDGVGLGLHELTFAFVGSRRALRLFEPFFGFHFTPVRSGSKGGLFTSRGPTQNYVEPGLTGGTKFGLALVPWENQKADERFELEAGLGVDYTYRGREYTEIWEALASPNGPCKPSEGCNNVLHSLSELDPVTGKPRRTDGITEVEPYTRFSGFGALHYQPIANVQLSARVAYYRETPHFITYGDVGKDLDKQNKVSQYNSQGQNEFSPVYLPAVDAVGQRLRVLDVSNLMFQFALTGKF